MSGERKVYKYTGPEETEKLPQEPDTAEDGEPEEDPELAEETGYGEDPEDVGYVEEEAAEEDYEARVSERRKRIRKKQTRKKRLTVLVMVLSFAFLATMCGKDIVRLKAENRALRKQQVALQKERDELKAELESTSEQEYIRDQARKQLRLLNPGELLFIFEDE